MYLRDTLKLPAEGGSRPEGELLAPLHSPSSAADTAPVQIKGGSPSGNPTCPLPVQQGGLVLRDTLKLPAEGGSRHEGELLASLHPPEAQETHPPSGETRLLKGCS